MSPLMRVLLLMALGAVLLGVVLGLALPLPDAWQR